VIGLVSLVGDSRIILRCTVACGQEARVGHAPLSHYIMEHLLDATRVGIFRVALAQFAAVL